MMASHLSVGNSSIGATRTVRPIAASEDFAFMLDVCPGSYLSIGNGVGNDDGATGCGLHHPGYDFNDACLATGASYWVALAERYLA